MFPEKGCFCFETEAAGFRKHTGGKTSETSRIYGKDTDRQGDSAVFLNEFLKKCNTGADIPVENNDACYKTGNTGRI